MKNFYNNQIGILRLVSALDESMNMKIRASKDGEWLGHCPAHCSEKLCFHVYPERNRYECKECGIQGDAFDFMMNLNQYRRASTAG